MPDLLPLFFAILVPALAAAVVAGICIRIRKGGEDRMPAAGAAAVGVGYLAGHIAVRGVPALPPGESADWIFWLALAAAFAGIGETGFKPGSLARPAGRLLISVAVPSCLLWRPIRGSFEVWWSAILVPALAGAVLLLWASLEALARRRQGIFRQGLVLSSAASASAGVLLAGSLVLAQLGGALAASLGGAGLAAGLVALARKKRIAVAEFAAGPTAVVLVAVLVNAKFYAEMSWAGVIFFFGSLLSPWIAQTEAAARLSPRRRLVVEALSVFLPLTAALGLEFAASPSFEE